MWTAAHLGSRFSGCLLVLALGTYSSQLAEAGSLPSADYAELKDLLYGTKSTLTVEHLEVLDSCQIFWVFHRESYCSQPFNLEQIILSFDLEKMSFQRRWSSDAWVNIILDRSSFSSGGVRDTPFNFEKHELAAAVPSITEWTGERTFEYTTYCGENDRVWSGDGLIPIPLTGKEADEFENIIERLQESCQLSLK